jgi:trigger factor
MNKKILAIILSLAMMLLVAACGQNGNTTTNGNTVSPSATATAGNTSGSGADVSKGGYVVTDYIKLGQYKGVKVTVEKLEVTEEDIEAAIQSDLYAKSSEVDVTDRAVQNGDTVNIDFQGMKDGVAFEGGTAEGYILEIGSGYFIPGFEEALIGHSIGEKVAIDLTFPADYQNADLAGQPVLFNVTINAIRTTVVPELNEDFVKNNTAYTSIEAYKASLNEQLTAQYQQEMIDQKQTDVLQAIIENAEIKSLPQSLLDYYFDDYSSCYSQIALTNGMDLETFVNASGATMDDFNSQAMLYAEALATQELTIKAIIDAEKMTLTDEEYNTGIDEIVSMYQYGSREELLKVVDKSLIIESLLMQKAIDFVTDQAVEG